MGRNTQILQECVDILSLPSSALQALEHHFHDRLILDVGNVDIIMAHARQLRLRITQEECPLVLDYIASKCMVGITIDHVEQANRGRPKAIRFGWLNLARTPTSQVDLYGAMLRRARWRYPLKSGKFRVLEHWRLRGASRNMRRVKICRFWV